MTETLVTAEDYAFVANLLRERCALVLEPGKEYLIKARLAPVALRHNLENIPLLINRIRRERQDALMTEVVEAMVTTEKDLRVHRITAHSNGWCRRSVAEAALLLYTFGSPHAELILLAALRFFDPRPQAGARGRSA